MGAIQGDHLQILKHYGRMVAVVLTTALGASTVEAGVTLAQLHHTAWSSRDGAPTGVNALAQSLDGRLWIGTLGGLFTFDGLHFTAFQPAEGQAAFPSLSVRSLLADPDGSIWVGFLFGGIARIYGGQVRVWGAAEGVPTGAVHRIVVSTNKQAWAVAGNRLIRLEGDRWRFVDGAEMGVHRQKAVHDVLVKRSGELVLASDDSIFLLPPGKNHFEKTRERVVWPSAMTQTDDGTVWLSEMELGVRPLCLNEGCKPNGKPVFVASETFALGSAGSATWVGTAKGVARMVAGSKMEWLDPGTNLSGGVVRAVLLDRENNIWTGTSAGLDRFRSSRFVPLLEVRNNMSPVVSAADNGAIWLGTRESPLLSLSGKGIQAHGGRRYTLTLAPSRDGAMWVNDGDALWHLKAGKFTKIPLVESIAQSPLMSIAEAADGTLYATFNRSPILKWAANNWEKLPPAPLAGVETALAVLSDSEGRLWAGYTGDRIGVRKGTENRTYSAKDGVRLGITLVITEEAGRIWAAGSSGLVTFTGTGFQRIEAAEHGILRGISGLVGASNGDLWANAASGVIRLPAGELRKALADRTHRVKTQSFDHRDGVFGLPEQLVRRPTAARDGNGLLWFATSGGVFWTDPNRVEKNAIQPIVRVLEMKADEAVLPLTAPVQLPARMHKAEIRFGAVSLAQPERLTYQYRLNGVESEWSQPDTRTSAIYTDLNPGGYGFEVRAANSDGVVSDIVSIPRIDVLPAFYETKWFRALCGLVVAAMLWLLYTIRLRTVAAAIRRQLEARANERVRIARELHDTLLQAIQGLMLRFHVATESLPEGAPARIELTEALGRADLVIAEGRDRVQQLRRQTSGDATFAESIAAVGQQLRWNKAVDLKVIAVGRQVELQPVAQDELCRIAREALANAFAHAQASKIEVELRFDPARFEMICRDNGIGIPDQVLEAGGKFGHFGLIGMRERAKSIGATLELRSAKPLGTALYVRIPAAKVYLRPAGKLRCVLHFLHRLAVPGEVRDSIDEEAK
ncbi:MAG: hypothetical protein K2X03_23565 [Bryobacteraceae bacterium]|nr:hypothetical protein [Bryobacteraceae bacterium]